MTVALVVGMIDWVTYLDYAGKKKLKDFLHQSDNRTCADCGAPDPKWA